MLREGMFVSEYEALFELDDETAERFENCADKGKTIADALQAYFTFGEELNRFDSRLRVLEGQVAEILSLLRQGAVPQQKPAQKATAEEDEKLDLLLDRLTM